MPSFEQAKVDQLASVLTHTPYEPLSLIGSGGQADVFEAQHRHLKQVVAVKVMKPGVDDQSLKDRLKLEGRVQAKIDHPSIVPISDYGETADGRPFLVMPRLHGMSLRNVMREVEKQGHAFFSFAIVRQIMVPVLQALQAAHQLGIVHRDLNPNNIYLERRTADGPPVVRILDFGLAKSMGDQNLIAPPTNMQRTAPGLTMGTTKYISPEQATANEIDLRTDIYAVGMTLYELLAGRGPYEHAEGHVERLIAHITQDAVPPSSFRATISADLDRVILRAIARDRDQRYASAQALIEALQALPDDADAMPLANGEVSQTQSFPPSVVRQNVLPAGPQGTVRLNHGDARAAVDALRRDRASRGDPMDPFGGQPPLGPGGTTKLSQDAARRAVEQFKRGPEQAALSPVASIEPAPRLNANPPIFAEPPPPPPPPPPATALAAPAPRHKADDLAPTKLSAPAPGSRTTVAILVACVVLMAFAAVIAWVR
ncbi:MAG: serine/threonine-protein kinase [Myxococcota bacterium]